MTQTALHQADPKTVSDWLAQNKAILIDIREADEHAREHISGARLAPLSRFGSGELAQERGEIAVFHCNSGNRTSQAASQLLSLGCLRFTDRASGAEKHPLNLGVLRFPRHSGSPATAHLPGLRRRLGATSVPTPGSGPAGSTLPR